VRNYPDQRFTLRNGIQVLGSIREDNKEKIELSHIVDDVRKHKETPTW
jgi:hypothetical protein